jgi:hypothetical protein
MYLLLAHKLLIRKRKILTKTASAKIKTSIKSLRSSYPLLTDRCSVSRSSCSPTPIVKSLRKTCIILKSIAM